MIFDASSGEIMDIASGKSQFSGVFRQLAYGFVAIIAAFAAYKIGWQRFFENAPYLFAGILFLLLLVFVPGIGICVNGSRRWIAISSFSLQPSEFLKIFIPAFFLYGCWIRPSLYTSIKEFLLFISILGLPVLLILVEPNNGTAGVIVLLLGLMVILCGIPARFWILPLFIALVGLGVFAASSTYVRGRLSSYLNPEQDIKGKGHQPYQAKIAAGSGGVFGKGPAKSMQKLSYLPEAQNDYIAAIFAEEFGFMGTTMLIGVYLWLFYEVWKIVSEVKEGVPFLWGLGILFLFSFQAFMNLGVVSGLLPSTGLNLPFFSQGGSSLVANSLSIGLLLRMRENSGAGAVTRKLSEAKAL
jgi:cell division protein FtsW